MSDSGRSTNANRNPKYDMIEDCKIWIRLVNMWNFVPSYVVSANTLNCLTTMFNQYIIYTTFIHKFKEPEAEVTV